MINIIKIEGIKLYGYHGCLDEESKIGGNYVVDVTVETNFEEAAENDDLEKTIDYCSVYDLCKQEMAIRSKLIERVCERIFTKIKDEFPQILNLNVKVTKLVPPMNGDVDRVSVEIGD